MKFLIQRVKEAKVEVNKETVGSINEGLLVLIGIKNTDTKEIADYMINKLIKLRIFEDENQKFNLNINDANGELLLVSQFTLYGNCEKGNRPSFDNAAKSNQAIELYNYIVNELKQKISKVETGIFGEYMQVSLVNDGPATFLLEKE